jgi:hypothetical protein
MKTLIVEICLGHDIGLGESYYRPSEEELLDEYLKAAPDLTFFEKLQSSESRDFEGPRAEVGTSASYAIIPEFDRSTSIPESRIGQLEDLANASLKGEDVGATPQEISAAMKLAREDLQALNQKIEEQKSIRERYYSARGP